MFGKGISVDIFQLLQEKRSVFYKIFIIIYKILNFVVKFFVPLPSVQIVDIPDVRWFKYFNGIVYDG